MRGRRRRGARCTTVLTAGASTAVALTENPDGSSAGSLTLGETRGAVLLGAPPERARDRPRAERPLVRGGGSATVLLRAGPSRRHLRRVFALLSGVSLSTARKPRPHSHRFASS